MDRETVPDARLRTVRVALTWAAVVAGLIFLFFNTITMEEPEWFVFLSNAIPFILMLILGVLAFGVHRRIKRNQTDSPNKASEDTAAGASNPQR